MPEMTPHVGLKKPLASETADISVINDNMEMIDSALGDLSTVPTAAKDAAGAITELFLNVSDGKALIASAITDKGVPTDANDSFAGMADNIEAIHVGPDTSNATASAGDLRAGKTAYVNEVKITGTIPEKGAANPGHEPAIGYDVSGSNIYLKAPKGIYDHDTWIVQPEPDLVSVNIKAGVNILGINGKTQVVDTTTASGASAAQMLAGREAFVNGVKVTGAAVNRNANAAATGIDGLTAGRINLRPPAGLWDGNAWVYSDDPDFIAANILENVNIFGLQGTLKRGKKFASVSHSAWKTTFNINGIDFVPSLAFIVFPGTYAVSGASGLDAGVTLNSIGNTAYQTGSYYTNVKCNIANTTGYSCDITISVAYGATFHVYGTGTIYLIE